MPTTQTVNEPPEAFKLVQRELASRGDGAAFARLVLRDIASGRRVTLAPCHIDWHEAVSTYQYVQILAPRDHGKSEQMVIARVLLELGLNPELRVKIVCENDARAVERIRSLRQHIEGNAELHAIFPQLVPQRGREWSDHRLTVRRTSYSKDASVEAVGILSAGTGGRADLLVFDDPVDYRNAIAHPAVRERVREVFWHDWFQLLEPHGRVIYIATPWHKADLTSEVSSRREFFHVIHRINLDGPEDPPRLETEGSWVREGILWPEKWGREALVQRKAAIGSRAFARAYQLQPLADEEMVFSGLMLEQARDPAIAWRQEWPMAWPRVMGVDLASSLGTRSSYTVMFVAVIDPQGRRIPVDIYRRRMTFPDTVRALLALAGQYHPHVVVVENNAYQAALVQHLAAEAPSLPVVGSTTGANKLSLELGVPSLAVMLERGGWVIPGADVHEQPCDCAYCVWEEELLSWPVGASSDTVMAMWLTEQAARRVWAGTASEFDPVVGVSRWRRRGESA